jgi:hypothetical protein
MQIKLAILKAFFVAVLFSLQNSGRNNPTDKKLALAVGWFLSVGTILLGFDRSSPSGLLQVGVFIP